MDLIKEPYVGYKRDRPADCFLLETRAQADIRYVVIGHSQVRQKWSIKMDKDELDFPIDWISFSGAKPRFLFEEVLKLVNSSTVPLRVIADVWQNAIGKKTVAELIGLMTEFEENLKSKASNHKVAIATCLFAPDLEKYWEDISQLNEAVKDYNIRSNIAPLNLHKAGAWSRSGYYRVVQHRHKEYNNDKSLGYHLDSEGSRKYSVMIRKHLLLGFDLTKDQKGKSNSDLTKGHNNDEQRRRYITPKKTMKKRSQKEWDARSLINRKRKDSINTTGSNPKRPRTDTQFQVVIDKNEQKDQNVSFRADMAEIREKQKTLQELAVMEKEAEEAVAKYKSMKEKYDEKQRMLVVKNEIIQAKEQDQAYREAEIRTAEQKLKKRYGIAGDLEEGLKMIEGSVSRMKKKLLKKKEKEKEKEEEKEKVTLRKKENKEKRKYN